MVFLQLRSCGVEHHLWTVSGKAISNSWALFEWLCLNIKYPKFHWFIIMFPMNLPFWLPLRDIQIGHFYMHIIRIIIIIIIIIIIYHYHYHKYHYH